MYKAEEEVSNPDPPPHNPRKESPASNYYGSSYLPKPMLIVPIVHPQQKPAMASTSPHPSAPSPGTLSPAQASGEPVDCHL